MRRILIAITAALTALAATPSSGQAAVPAQPPMAGVDTQAPRPDAPIVPLDHLSITVFREPDLSVQDVIVDETGHVDLPLVGGFMAAGKTANALSADIAAKLRQYLTQPEVAVALKQAAVRQVTITGSVVQPGQYPIDGRVTLLQAVALARGPSPVASMNQAFIFRTNNGQRTAARFDLNAIAKGKQSDPEVLAGDTVSIGSSGFKTAWRDVLDTVRSFSIWRVLP